MWCPCDMEVGIFFFQSVIFAPKTFSFMTNLLGYIPLDHFRGRIQFFKSKLRSKSRKI